MNNQSVLHPQDQVFWYLKRTEPQPRLTKPLKADVVVVGGGMAGLSVAQSFQEKGLSVVVLEKYFCGSGASGKSSGFITPDSELNLDHFTKKFGPAGAKQLWEFVTGGVELIRTNIQTFGLDCDYAPEDTLVVASSPSGFDYVKGEYQVRKKLAYESTLYSRTALSQALGSSAYYGGVRYTNTFGINTYLYCQGMKERLLLLSPENRNQIAAA